MKHPPTLGRRSSCFALGCSPSGRPVGLTRSLPRQESVSRQFTVVRRGSVELASVARDSRAIDALTVN